MYQAPRILFLLAILISCHLLVESSNGSKLGVFKNETETIVIRQLLNKQLVRSITRTRGHELPDKCGVTGRRHERSSGSKTPKNESQWPFFATLLNDDESKACGGTIISADLVITSFTCVNRLCPNEKLSKLRLAMGAVDRHPDSFDGKMVWAYQECHSKKFNQRPSINGANRSENDMSMIRLDEKLVFDAPDIQPACVLGSSIDMLKEDNSECFIVGHQTDGKSQMKAVYAPIEYLKCWMEDEYQFCFQGKREKKLSTCLNDSGGPILCKSNNKWHLVGIVSTVMDICDDSLPERGIYNVATNVGRLLKTSLISDCLKAL